MLEWYFWLLISIAILVFLIILRCIFNGPRTNLIPKNFEEKIIIVTGSNTGIGKITAIELLKKGAYVVFGARNEEKTLQIINSLPDNLKDRALYIRLDLSSFSSIQNFTEIFKSKFNKLDILINNAGGVFDVLSFSENIEHTTITNTIGPICLTALLMDYLTLSQNGKVINVSSRAHKFVKTDHLKYLIDSFELDNNNIKENFKGWDLYSLSKIGNIFYTKFLSDNYDKIKSVSVHPGVVNSDFFSVKRSELKILKCLKVFFYPIMWFFFKDSEMGAQTQLHCAYLEYNEMNSGAYFNNCKVEKLDEFAESRENRDMFMHFVKNMVMKNWGDNLPNQIRDHLNILGKNNFVN
jgi:NAD(P)-dependent dehydrogenase (short-subunit alcohol dehydrogenase family)